MVQIRATGATFMAGFFMTRMPASTTTMGLTASKKFKNSIFMTSLN